MMGMVIVGIGMIDLSNVSHPYEKGNNLANNKCCTNPFFESKQYVLYDEVVQLVFSFEVAANEDRC